MTGGTPLRRRGMLAAAGAAILARQAAAGAYPLTETDALGRAVTFAGAPRRAIAIGHAPYTQLAALGIRPVGAWVNPGFAAHTDYLFTDPRSIPSIANLDWSADPELIVQLRPDIVLGWYSSEANVFDPIAPFFAIREFGSVADVQANLRALARIMDATPRAEAAIAAFDRRLAAYRAVVPRDRSVLFVSGRDTTRFSVATTANMICHLADAVAVCSPLSPESAGPYLDVSIETLLHADPDVLVLSYARLPGRAAYLEALQQDPLWRRLKAVRTGRVVTHDGYQDLSIRGLPTAARLLDLVAPLVYPERLPGPLTDAQLLAALR